MNNKNEYYPDDEDSTDEQPQEEQPNTEIDSPDFDVIKKSEDSE
jgi:hypothetical protein